MFEGVGIPMNKLVVIIILLCAAAWGRHYQSQGHQAISTPASGQPASIRSSPVSTPWGGALQQASATAALAKLREYQVAQDQYRIEEQGVEFVFARQVPELFHLKGRAAGAMELVSKDLVNAWAGSARPIPYHGYLFAELTHGADGRPLDPHVQYGLCAYPAQSGAAGAVVMLVLHDDRTAAPIRDDRPVSSGAATLWAAPAERIPGPVTRWPSDMELRVNYVKPTRSIAEAQQAIGDPLAPAQRGAVTSHDLAVTH